MPPRTLVVWCPDWPVTAAGRWGSEPVVVVHANRVVACSAGARAAGVCRGLRRREAQARCPDVVVVPHDPADDARAFEPVVAAVEALTPRVEVVRPGLCAFATRGPARYYGGEAALVGRVRAEATAAIAAAVSARDEGGLDGAVGVGVADGRFAAEHAARHATVVPAGRGETAAFLAPLPVECLARPELAELLRLLGVHTLGALAALPAPDVLARFGDDGATAHRLARGLDERPLAGRLPPPDLDVAVELDPPAERVDQAAFAAKTLADDLHARLAALGLSCTRVLVEAETEHGETRSRLWRHDGVLTPAAMAERARWQLEGWLTGVPADRPTGGIARLRLAPDEVLPDHGRQLGFWGGETAGAARAARGLARVQGMLGPHAVVTAVLQGGRGPADRVRLVPWGEPREPAVPDDPAWPGRVPSPSPVLVFPVPVPAEVVDAAGQPVAVSGRGVASAAPARLSVDGGPWAAVAAWAGPWPVDERWWDPPAHRRRARWQVATAAGPAWLLMVEGGRWQVEAAYE